MTPKLTLLKYEDAAPESERLPTSPVTSFVFGSGRGPKVYLDSWLEEGLATCVLDHFRSIKTIVPKQPYWDLIWQLFSLKSLESEGSVNLFIKEGSNYHNVFYAIWDARHDHPEALFVGAIAKWMTNEPMTSEEWIIVRSLGLGEVHRTFDRINLLLFLTAISSQNMLLKPYVLALDGLEHIFDHPHQQQLISELFDLCLSAERWSRIGNPLTIRLEMLDATRTLSQIKAVHPRLFDLIVQAIH